MPPDIMSEIVEQARRESYGFDLSGIGEENGAGEAALDAERPEVSELFGELETWTKETIDRSTTRLPAVFFDIETGPRPDDELRTLYHEKTLEEFAADCDKRWKPETVVVKHEEYKARAWDEFVVKAAFSPITGRVLLLGTMERDEFYLLADSNEAANLAMFWEISEAALGDKIPLIGHNSNGFDLPFLVRRSWLLGVAVPPEIRHGRYWHPLFRDTTEHWSCGSRDTISLNALAAFFGVGQKTEGVKGADFAKLWFGTPEDRTKALEYNAQDLRLTAAIAAKMGMV